MDSDLGALPDDIEALKAALVAERGERIAEAARAAHTEAELAVARAKASDDQALIANQQLQIEKLTRQLYGPRSERTSRLLDQIELQFEELESSATADEIAAEMAVAKTTTVAAFTRKRPARKPFPEHLPRERVIVYHLLSRHENLTLEGKRSLKILLAANRRLNTAYVLKEAFGQLWDYGREGWARRFFDNWRASLKWQRLGPYERFADMIDRHWDGIAAYCKPENKVSLGFVEGLNNKIRVFQRRAYGLRDEEYLRLKVLTCMLPPL